MRPALRILSRCPRRFLSTLPLPPQLFYLTCRFSLVLSSCCDPCFRFKPNDALHLSAWTRPRLKSGDLPPHSKALSRSASREARKSVPLACGFEQEPRTTLGFIDPHFDETCRCDITMFVAHVVRLAQTRCERFVVVRQF